jgi:hypothetical protein
MLNLAALCSSGKTAKLNRRRQVEISDQIDFLSFNRGKRIRPVMYPKAVRELALGCYFRLKKSPLKLL